MKKFRLITALLLVLLMTVGNPLTALAASWDVTDSEGVSHAFATDTDAEVIINMQNDINMDTSLEANEGQNYVINGNGNTISDVIINGEGSVDINADVTSEESYAALEVWGQAEVTVEGDVTGEYCGVVAGDGSTVTVEGNVTSENGMAVDAVGADVTVTGDVTGEYSGIVAGEGSTVTVEGNVTANNGSAVNIWSSNAEDPESSQDAPEETTEATPEDTVVTVVGDVTSVNGAAISANSGTVEVTGNVTGQTGIYASGDAVVNVTGNVSGVDAADSESNWSGTGIYAGDNAEVTVDGNVSGGNGSLTEEEMKDPEGYSDGGIGIDATNEAIVTVTGDVSGGDGMGTFSYGGVGVHAEGESTVTVEGNVTGGDVVADPAVEALQEEVVIDAAGNTQTYYPCVSEGGDAVVANYGATVTVGGNVTGGSTNGDHGNGGNGILLQNYTMYEDEQFATGSVTVKGTASGGANGADGKAGAAVYYSSWYGYLPGFELQDILDKPAADLTANDVNILSVALNSMLMNGDLTEDELYAYADDFEDRITDDMTEDDYMLLYGEIYQKIIAAEATDLDSLVEEVPDYAKVTVGALSDKGGTTVDSDVGVEAAEEYAKTNITVTAPSTGSNPKTGDDFNGMFFAVLMSLSLLGIGVLLTQRKRIV